VEHEPLEKRRKLAGQAGDGDEPAALFSVHVNFMDGTSCVVQICEQTSMDQLQSRIVVASGRAVSAVFDAGDESVLNDCLGLCGQSILVAMDRGTAVVVSECLSAECSDSQFAELCLSLESSATIESLDLGGCRALSSSALSCVLQHMQRLRHLSLAKCRLGSSASIAAIAQLCGSTLLRTLDLSNSQLDAEGASCVATALRCNAGLVSVNVLGNQIPPAHACELIQALASSSSLTTLCGIAGTESAISLKDRGLGVGCALLLANELRAHASVTSLDVSSNYLGPKGGAHMAAVLEANSSLTHLNIATNALWRAGCCSVIAALAGNSTLTSLNISYNRMTAPVDGDWLEAISSLEVALSANRTLQALNLRSNGVKAEGAVRLACALRTNSALEHLDLSRNALGLSSEFEPLHAGIIALGEALKVNYGLRSLNISHNTLTRGEWSSAEEEFHRDETGVLAFVVGLQANRGLVSVDLTLNSISQEQQDKLQKVCCSKRVALKRDGPAAQGVDPRFGVAQ
jgi:Ran GTPase-activating protein (RanGAP) involved in mRNA processing and transport